MEVVTIKNYYDLQRELYIAKIRLKSLIQKRDLYFQYTQPGGMRFDEPMVMGGAVTNKFDTYVEKVEEINIQIKLIEKEIRILEEHLKEMEKALRQMKGTLEKIFVMRYIDGLSINQICKRTYYSRTTVYEKLNKIKKILR